MFGTVRYPCRLRLVRDGNTYSGYYRSADSDRWEPTNSFVAPLNSAPDPAICLFMSSNSSTNGVAVLDSFQCWGLDRPLWDTHDGPTVVTAHGGMRSHQDPCSPSAPLGTAVTGSAVPFSLSLAGRKLPSGRRPAWGLYLLHERAGRPAVVLTPRR